MVGQVPHLLQAVRGEGRHPSHTTWQIRPALLFSRPQSQSAQPCPREQDQLFCAVQVRCKTSLLSVSAHEGQNQFSLMLEPVRVWARANSIQPYPLVLWWCQESQTVFTSGPCTQTWVPGTIMLPTSARYSALSPLQICLCSQTMNHSFSLSYFTIIVPICSAPAVGLLVHSVCHGTGQDPAYMWYLTTWPQRYLGQSSVLLLGVSKFRKGSRWAPG